MGKKYIIELPENTHWIQWIMEGTKDHHPYMDWKVLEDLTPYIEPDLEQVRKEAYEEGKKQAKAQAELDVCHNIEKVAKENYKVGLGDAWEAVGKIYNMCSDVRHKIFKENLIRKILSDYTASEAIDKIRQYEQEKEEQIQVGDEVIATFGKAVIICINNDKDKARYIYPDSTLGFDNVCNLSKTGRRFSEIAAVLEKMRGEQE